MGEGKGPKKKNAVKSGITTADDIKAPFFTRFIFTIVNICMGACIAMGLVLCLVGAAYSDDVSDSGLAPCVRQRVCEHLQCPLH